MKVSSRYQALAKRARKSPEYWTERALLDLSHQFGQAMKKHGVTQKALAERIEKKPAFVSRAFSGKQNLTVATATLLALALDMHVTLKLEPNGAGERKPVHTVTSDRDSFVPSNGVVVRSRKLILLRGANEGVSINSTFNETRQAA